MERVVADERDRSYRLIDRSCPVCESTRQQVLGWRGGEYQRYGKGAPTRIVRCRCCGVVFPNPFPVPTDAQEIYGDPDKYFGERDVTESVEIYRGLVGEIRVRTGTEQPRILDVGSGRGEFLEAAAREGIEFVVGLELSQAMSVSCRERFGVEVRLETIEEHARTSKETYDAVLLLAIIEHVYNPDSMISAAARLSRAGSALRIDCPIEPNVLTHVGNAMNRIRRSEGVLNLSPTFEPFHVFGFNPASLRFLLEKHGFRIDEVETQSTPIPSNGSLRDRITSRGVTELKRLIHLFGHGTNMGVWATFVGC